MSDHEPPSASAEERQATILLVEDALDLANVVARELRAAGYRVHHARDGLAALDAAARVAPDLIVLDWMLPKLDGIDVLRRLRQTSPVPVLMLTARGEIVDRVVGLEVGADDYLTKPFSMHELIARIRALLRRVERGREAARSDRSGGSGPLSYGDLWLDPEAYVARLGDRDLTLTRTEFELLRLFLQHPGRVFSRPYLLQVVWKESFVDGDRSVDNAVLRLRKKLGHLGECVETVWGVGYRMKRR